MLGSEWFIKYTHAYVYLFSTINVTLSRRSRNLHPLGISQNLVLALWRSYARAWKLVCFINTALSEALLPPFFVSELDESRIEWWCGPLNGDKAVTSKVEDMRKEGWAALSLLNLFYFASSYSLRSVYLPLLAISCLSSLYRAQGSRISMWSTSRKVTDCTAALKFSPCHALKHQMHQMHQMHAVEYSMIAFLCLCPCLRRMIIAAHAQ